MNEEATFYHEEMVGGGSYLSKEYHCSKGIVHLRSLS